MNFKHLKQAVLWSIFIDSFFLVFWWFTWSNNFELLISFFFMLFFQAVAFIGLFDFEEVEKGRYFVKEPVIEYVKTTVAVNELPVKSFSVNRLLFKVIVVVCILSFAFNGIQFAINTVVSNANASLVVYLNDLNCGLFGRDLNQAFKDSNFYSSDLNLGKLGVFK